MKTYNTYYNLVNDMEPAKSVSSTLIAAKDNAPSKPLLPENVLKNSMIISVAAGAGLGLAISLFSHKNYILNPLLGAVIGFAGNEFVIKGKNFKKKPKTE